MRTFLHHRKYKGVYPIGNKFRAVITYDKKNHHIGTYATEEDAARAYDLEAKLYHRDKEMTK